MGIFSNIKSNFSNIGANTASKFNALVNSTNINNNPLSILGLNNTSTRAMLKSSVLNNNTKGRGVSHAADVKARMEQIEWSRGYSWDVFISPEPEAPFNQKNYGIPVVDVNCEFALFGVTHPYGISNATYNVPKAKNYFDIRLTLLDDEEGTMEQYFEDWQNAIYSWADDTRFRGTVNYLEDSVRQLDLHKLDSHKREIFTRSYLVYPEQGMVSMNNSTGQVRQFNVNLVVAGYLGKTRSTSIVETSVSSKIVAQNNSLGLIDKIKSTFSKQKEEYTGMYPDEYLFGDIDT